MSKIVSKSLSFGSTLAVTAIVTAGMSLAGFAVVVGHSASPVSNYKLSSNFKNKGSNYASNYHKKSNFKA